MFDAAIAFVTCSVRSRMAISAAAQLMRRLSYLMPLASSVKSTSRLDGITMSLLPVESGSSALSTASWTSSSEAAASFSGGS